MFKIKDDNGHVFNEVKVPAAVYDSRNSVLLKIGEKKLMKEYYEIVQKHYRLHGFDEIADDICLMELPKDQKEIDKVFQICDYIGNLHKKYYKN